MFTNDDTNKGHKADLTFLFRHSHLRLNSCHNDLIKAICSTLKSRYHTNLLSDGEKKKIYDRLYKANISNIHPIIFILVIVHGAVSMSIMLLILIRAFMPGNIAARKAGREKLV
jgi:hypothetical protein